MPDEEKGDKPNTPELEAKANSIRRRLNDYYNTIEQIRNWGKTATSNLEDKDGVAFFRGMLKSLDSTYEKFEEKWYTLEDLKDEGAVGVPTKDDMGLRKNAKSSFYNARKYAEMLNELDAQATRAATAEAARAAAVATQASAAEAARAAADAVRASTSSAYNASMANISAGGDYRIAKSLPKLQLPKFEGKLTDWPKFRDSFQSLVEKDPCLAPVDKLNYLRDALVGPAFSVISHLGISDANYALAWSAVTKAFDNQRVLASTYLDQLLLARHSGKATPESLQAFLSNVGDSVAAFKLLNIPDADEFILFHLAVRALDPATREQFETAQKNVTFPKIDSLIKFVRERSTTLMLANMSVSTSTPQPIKREPKPPKPHKGTALLTQDKSSKRAPKDQSKSGLNPVNQPTNALDAKSSSIKGTCPVCLKTSHHLLSCETFHGAPVDEKWRMISKWSGCINCLGPNHRVDSCPSKWKCRFCAKRHHSSLHRSANHPSTGSQQVSYPIQQPDNALNSIIPEEGQVVLGSAVVEILDARGEYQPVRVVVDSGSQNSFMTIKCLNKLGLTMQHLRKRISGIGQTPFEGTKGKTVCILRPRGRPSIQLKTEAIVVTNITSYLPAKMLPLDFVQRCTGFDLADPAFWKPAAVDFLIGADLFSQIMTGSIIPIHGSQASLFSSIFGYIVLGKISELPSEEPTSSLFAMDEDDDLNRQLKRFWEIEEPVAVQVYRNPDDEQCEEHFQQTHSRLPNGRYVIRLPFKEPNPQVGDSSHVARKRFLNLEKKLEANPALKRSYHETINDYLQLDHMTAASMPTSFVIPHHCVSKEEKDTVKTVVSLSDKEDSWVKLLGLQWDPEDDAFLFSFQTPTAVYSKRGILSTVARLYDPLGFLTPVTLMMKAIVQDLWKLDLNWDDTTPEQIKTLWDSILSELHLLSCLRIPRFLHTESNYACHIVGFSDASLKGYAAVLYLRVNTRKDGWQVSLLTAKSKLAPTKVMSIPRLELCGALLLAQLYSSNLQFLTSISSPFLAPSFHTDSSIVLGWLSTPTYKLQTFVANRIVKIQEFTEMSSWRHVDSEQNPADVASRGLLPSQLISDELWWKGPPWLAEPQEAWPSPTFTVSHELPEMKANATLLVATYAENPWIAWMKKFSSFQKILRIVAWVNRWIYNVKHVGCCCCRMRTGPLRLFELQEALSYGVKWTQQHHIFHGHPFSHVQNSFANLKPFIDSTGIVRVGGRIRKADLSESQRFPILMPTEAHLTVLMVDHYHKAYLHPGPNLLQAIIQRIYWVPSLRRLIRKRGFHCMTCYRSKPRSINPLMGDLPAYRVNGGRPFLHVGVDFAGPFRMKESSRRKAAIGKVYLCLFVCMATKALHLEAVTRLTTDAFLAALERFTSRRGLPSDIYSDRGSNFLGAASYLSELYEWFTSAETKEHIANYALKARIDWHFNPPLTPHMGGIWEAGVKSVKSHLYKVTGEAVLTFEEMSTLFYKIEAILNSRPLCPLSSSPEETDYLSPGHFLVGGTLVSLPQPSYLDLKENLLDRWQFVSAMSQRFWQRWRSEYLNTLQKRPKWMQRTPNLKVGDLVLLKEDSHPLCWPMGKILEVKPGDDGVVRVATVKTPRATYQRPAVKLIPLLPLTEPPY